MHLQFAFEYLFTNKFNDDLGNVLIRPIQPEIPLLLNMESWMAADAARIEEPFWLNDAGEIHMSV